MYILYMRVYEILTYTYLYAVCVRCYQWHVLAVRLAVLCARGQLPNV